MIAVFGGMYVIWFSPGAPMAPIADKGTASSYSDAITAAKQAAESMAGPVAGGAKVEVYTGISVGDKSTVLDLSGKQLTGSLKAEVRLLQALTELNLSNNQFTGIPAEIGQLSELRVLNLSGNPVTGLPQEIGNLQKLQILDLRNTSYSKQDLESITARLPRTTKILVD